jgi:hypothetical protein
MTGWQLFQAAVMWGPGILILAGVYALVRRPPRFIGEFIEAEKTQAVAMSKMADAVEAAVRRDNAKLDELLVNDQLIIRRIEEIARGLESARRP